MGINWSDDIVSIVQVGKVQDYLQGKEAMLEDLRIQEQRSKGFLLPMFQRGETWATIKTHKNASRRSWTSKMRR